jgi:hypothetical protein
MNRSSSSTSSKVVQIDNEDSEELVTINEKVNLTKNQHEVLQMVCNFYEIKPQFITIILQTGVLHDIADWQSDKYVLVNAL